MFVGLGLILLLGAISAVIATINPWMVSIFCLVNFYRLGCLIVPRPLTSLTMLNFLGWLTGWSCLSAFLDTSCAYDSCDTSLGFT